MKFKISLVLILLAFFTAEIKAQTMLISFKSHSGNAGYFNISPFDEGTSNYGEAPRRFITNAVLDSVKFVSDSVAVMFTGMYCSEQYSSGRSLWKAGKDTVYNHPLFSKQHALDSIKRVLKQQYYFKQRTDSTKFIGYDNTPPSNSQKKNFILPLNSRPNHSDDLPWNEIIWIFHAITIFSFLIAYFSRKQNLVELKQE